MNSFQSNKSQGLVCGDERIYFSQMREDLSQGIFTQGGNVTRNFPSATVLWNTEGRRFEWIIWVAWGNFNFTYRFSHFTPEWGTHWVNGFTITLRMQSKKCLNSCFMRQIEEFVNILCDFSWEGETTVTYGCNPFILTTGIKNG